MIKHINLAGVWTAIATPFMDNESIDEQAFETLLALQIQAQVSGILIGGTTGESPALSDDEKLFLIKKAKSLLPPSIKIMAGTGGNNTLKSAELSKKAQDAGADIVLIVTPPYNKPTINGLKAHYDYISKNINIPICLYHVPTRTSQTLNPQAFYEILAYVPQIVAIKEASGNIALFSQTFIKCNIESHFTHPISLLSGDDFTYLASLSVGAAGCISVISNLFPKEMVLLTEYFNKGQIHKALQIHNALMPSIEALFCETNPGPLKAALHIMGLANNNLRLPLAKVTENNYTLINNSIQKTKNYLRNLSL